MNNPATYNAVWWVPEGIRRFSGDRHVGMLTYFGDSNSTLEIYHDRLQGSIFRAYDSYDVIWGQSADGQIFTLFKTAMVRQEQFSLTLFNVDFILIGAHIKSMDEPCFGTCVSSFPYLRNWAFDQRVKVFHTEDGINYHLNMEEREPLISFENEYGFKEYLWGHLSCQTQSYSISVEQITTYNIERRDKASINQYLILMSEFSQFLSIALFCPQHPIAVKFQKEKGEQYFSLLFKIKPSIEPRYLTLIKFKIFKDRIPAMLKEWHAKYEQIAPIANYLIRSMRYDTPFEVPDFLIVAQALDGYFKRFVNKKDGKDTRKYKDGIDKLLRRFKNVELLKICRIDSDVLNQSRDKYSHLIPDEDTNVHKAVEGPDLFWLTQKCKILLTCCILDMLGLTIDEINVCCRQSPLSFIVNSLPPEL